MSVAFNSDVDLTVEIAFDSDPFATSQTFSDVSAYIREFSIDRGRQHDLAEATKISAENILTEALAIKELEKAFGSFEGETFKRTLEEIALITGRKIAEIERAFANAGLTESSFSAPDSGSSGGSTPPVSTPTFAESNGNESGNVGTGSGGNVGTGGSVAQPVKIYTTLNIGSERFETVTQDAIIQLQKQGKRVLL